MAHIAAVRKEAEKMLKGIENRIAKEKTAAIYKDIEERKQQLVHNIEERYICIDDGQGGKIAIKKR